MRLPWRWQKRICNVLGHQWQTCEERWGYDCGHWRTCKRCPAVESDTQGSPS